MNDESGTSKRQACLTFDVDAEAPILAIDSEHVHNAMAMTHQAFGPLVGVPRIIRLLADYDIKSTFFVPGVTAIRYPGAVELILEAGHEVAHHTHRHISALDLSPAEERKDFEQAFEALERLGVTPKGHRAALWEATWNTPELVAEFGMTYDSSLMDADSPYLFDTRNGRKIVELPPHWSLDDWEQYAFLPRPDIGQRIVSPIVVAEMWIHELKSMHRHGALFVLTNHPFLSGRAGRVEALRSVIEAGIELGDLKFTTCLEVAERALSEAGTQVRRPGPPELI